MDYFFHLYISYIFPFLAFICVALLLYIKKKLMKNFPEKSFIELLKEKNSKLDQALLFRYRIIGIFFAILTYLFFILIFFKKN